MNETLSLYRELDELVICFHNKNILPHTNVPHLHSQYEFYYNIDGASGMFIDKKLYECTGHDLFLIPRLSVHKVLVSKGMDYERCIINIDSKVVDAINAAPGLHRPLLWMESAIQSAPKKVNLNEEEHQAFVRMIGEYNEAKDELLRYSVFIKILAFLSGFFAIGKKCEGTLKETALLPEQALMVVEEHFKDIKITDLSQKLYVNSSHLSSTFKEEYGITLEQYLIIRKIAEAKKYLYMGVPVNEVCELCGFHNYANFMRTFKKYEGYSPKSIKDLNAPL